MQGLEDLFVTTENAPTVAAQSMAASATVHGSAVKTQDRESIVAEVHVGTLTGSPTGGTVTAILEESASGSGGWAQVSDPILGNLQVVANYSDTLPEILRMRYLAGANGKQPYVRISITTALTGGTSPTAIVAANILKGGLRYAGAQPGVGSYPQTVGSGLTN